MQGHAQSPTHTLGALRRGGDAALRRGGVALRRGGVALRRGGVGAALELGHHMWNAGTVAPLAYAVAGPRIFSQPHPASNVVVAAAVFRQVPPQKTPLPGVAPAATLDVDLVCVNQYPPLETLPPFGLCSHLVFPGQYMLLDAATLPAVLWVGEA